MSQERETIVLYDEPTPLFMDRDRFSRCQTPIASNNINLKFGMELAGVDNNTVNFIPENSQTEKGGNGQFRSLLQSVCPWRTFGRVLIDRVEENGISRLENARVECSSVRGNLPSAVCPPLSDVAAIHRLNSARETFLNGRQNVQIIPENGNLYRNDLLLMRRNMYNGEGTNLWWILIFLIIVAVVLVMFSNRV